MNAPHRGQLAWQCRRGALELDVMLSNFLATGYASLSLTQQHDFVRLLALSDPVLMDLLLGRQNAEDPLLALLVEKIRPSA